MAASVTGFTPDGPIRPYHPAVIPYNRVREARAARMNRLFDKMNRNVHPLRWLGTRPVDGVREAERRAMTAGRAVPLRAPQRATRLLLAPR